MQQQIVVNGAVMSFDLTPDEMYLFIGKSAGILKIYRKEAEYSEIKSLQFSQGGIKYVDLNHTGDKVLILDRDYSPEEKAGSINGYKI